MGMVLVDVGEDRPRENAPFRVGIRQSAARLSSPPFNGPFNRCIDFWFRLREVMLVSLLARTADCHAPRCCLREGKYICASSSLQYSYRSNEFAWNEAWTHALKETPCHGCHLSHIASRLKRWYGSSCTAFLPVTRHIKSTILAWFHAWASMIVVSPTLTMHRSTSESPPLQEVTVPSGQLQIACLLEHRQRTVLQPHCCTTVPA